MPEARRSLAAAAIGVLIGPFDVGLVAVALPTISEAQGGEVSSGQLAILAYVLALALGYVPFGALSDRRPPELVLRAGLAAFALGSVVVALAPAFSVALAGRALQGLGAAAAVSAGQALAFLVAGPARTGRNLGFVHVAVGVGALSGPVVGGWLLERLSWQSIFLVEPLIAILGIALVPTPPARQAAGRGRVTRQLALGLTLALLAFTAMSANIFLEPYLLQVPFGLSPSSAGGLLAIVPIVILIGAIPGGILADRVGSRVPTFAGLALVALGILGLALSVRTDALGALISTLAVYGGGAALFQAPNNRAILAGAPGAVGLGSGLLGASRQIGQALGVLAAGFLLSIGGGPAERSAYELAFTALAGVAAAAAALALARSA